VGRPAVCALRDRSRALDRFPRAQPSVDPRGWRRSAWLEGAATAAAALLVVDAWFDVMTSSTHLELAIAIGEAVLIELPLATLCYLLARDAEHVLRRRTTSGSP
jgi:hypothetical protein